AVHGEIVPRGGNTGPGGRASALPAARARRRAWCAGIVRPAGAGRSRARRSPRLLKRARRGCLTAPSTMPEGDLIGVRLSRDVLGQPPRPGRCLLHTGDGKLTTV